MRKPYNYSDLSRDITVIIQTCPQRCETRKTTLQSVEASDIGRNYELLEQPPRQDRKEFFRDVLDVMSKAATPYVLRLEDDVLVNKYILHNALTWPALEHPLFGCGWLMTPQAVLEHRAVNRKTDLGDYRELPECHCSLAVLIPTVHVPSCIEDARKRKDCCQDLSLSRGVWQLGKRVFFHKPCLGENRDWDGSVGSAWGSPLHKDPTMCRAGRYFDPNYRRS